MWLCARSNRAASAGLRVSTHAVWEERATDFLRIILMKAMREEKLLFSIASYVGQQQGNDFKEPRPWRLEDVFHGTSARSPVVFVLTTGADPTAMLQRFGESKGWLPGERLHMISLGQGQVLHTPFF